MNTPQHAAITTVCPCRRQVPLDYSTREPRQAAFVQTLIAEMGEFLTMTVGARSWRVSRHCLALHGVRAADIDSYGFEEVTSTTP